MIKNKLIILFAFLLIFPARSALSDWVQAGGSLNVNPTNEAFYPTIAITNNTPYITWRESFSTFNPIYVKYYNGSNWLQAGGNVTHDMNHGAGYPRIAASNGTPHVTWYESYGTSFQIFVKYFDGNSWLPLGPGSLNVSSDHNARYPSIAITGNTPYVTWQELDPVYQIYVKHFNGSDWVQDGGSLNIDPAHPGYYPGIAITESGTPYVSWRETNGASIRQLYVSHYNAGGGWLQDNGSLNMNPYDNAYSATIAILNGTPFAVWEEEAVQLASQVQVKHYNGNSWSQDGGSLNLNIAQDAKFPSMVFFNGTPFVAWRESNGTADQIYVKYFNGQSWIQDGGSLNVNPGQNASYPRLAASNGTMYAAWREFNGSTNQIYAKHFVPSELAVTPTSTPIATHTSTPGKPPLLQIQHGLVRIARGESAQMLINLPRSGLAQLGIYDLTGRLVIELLDRRLNAGTHEITWDGSRAGSGTYLVFLNFEGEQTRGKLVVVR